jgi:hypothetical protein
VNRDPEVDSIKLFGVNLVITFCKLNHFINVNNICHIELKRLRFENEGVNLHQKSFMRLSPCHKTFIINVLTTLSKIYHFITVSIVLSVF